MVSNRSLCGALRASWGLLVVSYPWQRVQARTSGKPTRKDRDPCCWSPTREPRGPGVPRIPQEPPGVPRSLPGAPRSPQGPGQGCSEGPFLMFYQVNLKGIGFSTPPPQKKGIGFFSPKKVTLLTGLLSSPAGRTKNELGNLGARPLDSL